MTDTLDELKHQFLTDQGAEGELKHVGVKGMRWGHRKGTDDSRPTADAVYKARGDRAEKQIELAGHKSLSRTAPSVYGDNKIKNLKKDIQATNKVANLSANKRELAAKAQFGGAIVAGLLAYAGGKALASGALPYGKARTTAHLISAVGQYSALALTAGGAITAASAAKTERQFHNS